MNSRVNKVILPVAGLGTRLLPATKSIPKEIMTLVDRPVIQYIVDEAKAAGIEQFICVTSHGKSALENYFDRSHRLEMALRSPGKEELLEQLLGMQLPSGSIAYVRQETPLGLGHAIHCAHKLVGDEPIAVMLPDDVFISKTPVLRQMTDAHAELGGTMVAVAEVPRSESSNYGMVETRGRNGRIVPVSSMVEKPAPEDAPSNLAVVGRYILTPRIMRILGKVGPGVGGEIQLTDAIALEAARKHAVNGFLFEGLRFDCGSKLGFLEATMALALRRPEFNAGLRARMQALLSDPEFGGKSVS